jgi:hypothetical protein
MVAKARHVRSRTSTTLRDTVACNAAAIGAAVATVAIVVRARFAAAAAAGSIPLVRLRTATATVAAVGTENLQSEIVGTFVVNATAIATIEVGRRCWWQAGACSGTTAPVCTWCGRRSEQLVDELVSASVCLDDLHGLCTKRPNAMKR